MTDPNGNTCVWTPEGECPPEHTDSGPKKIYTTYHSPTATPIADGIRVAMTRSRSDEPTQIETVVVREGEIPQPVVLLAGTDALGPVGPDLATIGEHTYFTWIDRRDRQRTFGALLDATGELQPGTVIELGSTTGHLRVAGKRFLFVDLPRDQTGLLGTWIEVDGKPTKTVLASNIKTLLDVSDGNGFIALATVDTDNEFAITRMADDGTVIDRTALAVGSVQACQLATTADGGVLAVLTASQNNSRVERIIRIETDGTVQNTLSALPMIGSLVRGPSGHLAVSAGAPLVVRVLDDRGAEIVPPVELGPTVSTVAIATPSGFAVIHETTDASISLTPLPAGVRVAVAEATVEEVGCDCHSANGKTSVAFALVLLVVLRRRKRDTGR